MYSVLLVALSGVLLEILSENIVLSSNVHRFTLYKPQYFKLWRKRKKFPVLPS